MKLQLDTTNKTILIDQEVTFGDLLDTLEQLLPNGKWADFKLIPNNQIDWGIGYPLYTPDTQHPTLNYPWITSFLDNNDDNYYIKYGVFNISSGE